MSTTTRIPWCTHTRKRERPVREVDWTTPLRNGDIQVIYEYDTTPVSHPSFVQNYYMSMYSEGEWHPMAQLKYDFDVCRHAKGFERIEMDPREDYSCCGLFRDERIDQRPLYQQGYASAFLSYAQFCQALHWGGLTHEWSWGRSDAGTDKMLADGYVDTDRPVEYKYERIEKVQYLL